MRSDYCPVANEPCQNMCLGDCCLKRGVQQAKLEEELAECKAAYESQFKELHALKKAISEAEPVMIYHGNCVIDCGEHGHQNVEMLKMISAGSPLYTLKGIK